MINLRHLTSLTALVLSAVLVAACADAGSAPDEHAGAALSARGGDQCVAITNADLDALRVAITDGLALAEQDALANGPAGRYGVAAETARDAFANALAFLDEYRQELADSPYDNDPTTTDGWEGSHGGGYAWAILEQLQQAVHWGSVSAIYHTSELARSEIEEAFRAIELADALRVRGQRCYVDAYFPK